MSTRSPLLWLVGASGAAWIWSGIHPYDRGVWFFENVLGIAGVLLLVLTYRRFRFSNLVYVLVGIHVVILAMGAKYTYAEMPAFNWLRDTFGLARNYYDRVGHFAQGFFPAIMAREILLRTTALRPGKMLSFLVASVCLAMSAFYELIEWWIVLLFYPTEGPEWLGLQGDPWDAQQDMLMALLGAVLALTLLSRAHDRSLRALTEDTSRETVPS